MPPGRDCRSGAALSSSAPSPRWPSVREAWLEPAGAPSPPEGLVVPSPLAVPQRRLAAPEDVPTFCRHILRQPVELQDT